MEFIKNYFDGEKAESLLFMGFGILALFFAVYFYFFTRQDFWKGVAIPFAIVAVLEIIVGTTILLRSPKDIVRVENVLKNEPKKMQSEEMPRIEKVLKNFVYYRYFEISMILLGTGLMFSISNYDFWKGVGLGLFIQCSIVLTLDFFAEKRGHSYLHHLQTIEISENDK